MQLRMCVMFVLILYVPVNNFSVMLGQFWVEPVQKQRITCFVQRHNTVTYPIIGYIVKPYIFSDHLKIDKKRS